MHARKFARKPAENKPLCLVVHYQSGHTSHDSIGTRVLFPFPPATVLCIGALARGAVMRGAAGAAKRGA
jgi:hypothetical protein